MLSDSYKLKCYEHYVACMPCYRLVLICSYIPKRKSLDCTQDPQDTGSASFEDHQIIRSCVIYV